MLKRVIEHKEAPLLAATDRAGIGPASSSKLQSARGLRLTDAGRIGELSLRAGWDLEREEAESATAKAKPYGKRNGLD
jgi:hypothetical protein